MKVQVVGFGNVPKHMRDWAEKIAQDLENKLNEKEKLNGEPKPTGWQKPKTMKEFLDRKEQESKFEEAAQPMVMETDAFEDAQLHSKEVSAEDYWINRLFTAANVCLNLNIVTDYGFVDAVHRDRQKNITIQFVNDAKGQTSVFTESVAGIFGDGIFKVRAMAEELEASIKSGIEYPHYVKYIGDRAFLDFYGFCELFGISDKTGSLYHGQKKIFNLGNRGDKGYIKDLREAIQSFQVTLREAVEESYNDDVN